jgi:hypothetical protein
VELGSHFVGEGNMSVCPPKREWVFPTCAICNKPVDKVTSTYDLNLFSTVYRVYCHGQVEEQRLSDEILVSSLKVTFGLAFERPLLEKST